MSRIDEILDQQKKLAEELEVVKKEQRNAVLEDLKKKIKLFGFKTTDFKGVLRTRKGTSNSDDKSKPKSKSKKKAQTEGSETEGNGTKTA